MIGGEETQKKLTTNVIVDYKSWIVRNYETPEILVDLLRWIDSKTPSIYDDDYIEAINLYLEMCKL